MDLGGFKHSRYAVMFLFGICMGVLSLIVLECADDFMPALALGVLIGGAAALLFVRLPKSLRLLPVLMLAFSGITVLYGMDGIFEDAAEALLIVSAVGGFLYSIINLLFGFAAVKDQKRLTDDR